MKYAIIAAGEGSRLAQEGIEAPKPLVKVHGEHLIDRLLRIFMMNDAEEIVVICNNLTTEVSSHLKELQDQGELYGNPLPPLRFLVKTTPSSMHSFYELSKMLTADGSNSPFILTTVDTIFREEDFKGYVRAFKQSLDEGLDGLMGVTYYIDDEKPLYVETNTGVQECSSPLPLITNFLDTCDDPLLISGGIYGLTPRAFTTLNACIERGESRMRNFQRALIRDGLKLRAYPFLKVLDIDHASDIQKAEQFLSNKKMKVLALTRAPHFSPNSVEKDRDIMLAVVRNLYEPGVEVTIKDELTLTERDLETPDIVLNMGRQYRTQSLLLDHFHGRVINSAKALKGLSRQRIDQLMRENGLPAPPLKGDDGYWLKRDDGFCDGPDDVVYCPDEVSLQQAELAFVQSRHFAYTKTAHVVGDVVKFYAVRGTDFFRYFYPTDDGQTKFSHEQHNGTAHHYPFDAAQLHHDVERLAMLTGIEVYGGDVIVRADGSYCIIDFNDWPSFSRCREEAAEAIVEIVKSDK